MEYLSGLSTLTSWLSPDQAAPAPEAAAATGNADYGPTASANGSIAAGATPFMGQYDSPILPINPGNFTPEYTDKSEDYGGPFKGYSGKLKLKNPVMDNLEKTFPGLSGPQVNVNGGFYTDEDGKETMGVNASADALKYKNDHLYQNERGKIGIDAGGGAGIKATANDDTSEVGASAGPSIALTAATTGTDHDESARFGLSEGPGLAVRTHYGDTDKDGRRDYGFGLDVGPVTMDFRTEDPARSALGGVAGQYTDLALSAIGADPTKNVTDQATEKVAETYQGAKEVVSEKVDAIEEGASETYHDVVDGASENLNTAKKWLGL